MNSFLTTQTQYTTKLPSKSGFNEVDVRRAYRLFPPRGGEVTQLVAIRKPHPIFLGFYDDEDSFVQAAWEHAGERNLYYSINAFDKSRIPLGPNLRLSYAKTRGTADDICRVRGLALDFDVSTPRRREARAISPTGDAASTLEELHTAKVIVRSVLAQHPFDQGQHLLIMSGNGFQAIPRLDIPVDDANRFEVAQRMKTAGDLIRRTFGTPEVKIDSTFDLPRIFALPGTGKMKGDDPSLWRMVEILDETDVVEPEFARWFHDADIESQPIFSLVPGHAGAPSELCPLWKALYEGTVASGDRSMDLVLLGARLLWHGYDAEDVAFFLAQSDAKSQRKYTGRADAGDRYHAIAEDDAPIRTPDCSFVKNLAGAPKCTPCRHEVDYSKRPMIKSVIGRRRSDFVDDPFDAIARIVEEVLP